MQTRQRRHQWMLVDVDDCEQQVVRISLGEGVHLLTIDILFTLGSRKVVDDHVFPCSRCHLTKLGDLLLGGLQYQRCSALRYQLLECADQPEFLQGEVVIVEVVSAADHGLVFGWGKYSE